MAKRKKIPANNRLMERRSPGAFRPTAWLDEGDRLLAVGLLNRKLFQRRRRSLPEKIRKQGLERVRYLHELEGSPRASWMLIGYAIEMYLKAGLAKAYARCAESMFKRDVKSRFSHNLERLAEEIAFSSDPDEKNALKELTETLQAGRYPPFADDARDHARKVNAQTRKQWNDDEFRSIVTLAKRVRAHAARIDGDSKNSSFTDSLRIDEDGYVAFRMGGHLPTRITYRVSSNLRKTGETALLNVVDLLVRHDPNRIINRYWPKAVILEDGENDKGQKETIPRFYEVPTRGGA